MITCTFEKGYTAKLRHVVVHAIVEMDGKLLLVKRVPEIREGGKWSLVSGFMSRDETANECVLRELKEETGWEGEIIALFRIDTNPVRPNDDWQNVALEFLIRPVKITGEPDKESSKIEWIPTDKLIPLDEFAFDHGETIGLYLKYRKKPFPLPILD